MSLKGAFILLTITYLTSNSSSSAREIPFQSQVPGFNNPTAGDGLETEGGALDCWTALYKIRSCSNEIIAYFANGAIDITPPCCEAITLITHQCWPAVLSTLGYSPDQANILRGYCDASVSYAFSFGPISSPLGSVISPLGPSVN
ncbi:hypothetical protein BUALT_Bualt04G0010900 [Buddleja alternifolia]|uniref:Prolamin-like domain-containing protein n=1 Tax=Buddleja alternifolia TaxID=168488 RepID=A0AAV6XPL8_9LAMI|nr:hypothetical protein BUALT_Bualt04G0010900 [Buddleja alternifolia]